MLEILLATLPSLLPQDPPVATSVPAAAITTDSVPAHWLPETTLAALIVEPVAADGPVGTLLGNGEGQQLTQLAARLLQPAMTELSLSFAELTTALRGGFAVAFVGFTAGQQPDVVFIADLGTATPTLAARLAKLPTSEGMRVVGTGPSRMLIGIRAGHVAVGSDAATITATLNRAVDSGGPSLADELDFVRSRTQDDGQTFAQFFVRIGDLAASVTDHLPKEMVTPVRRSIDVLGFADMHWAGATWQVSGEELVTRWQLEAPRAEGLLDALAGTVGRLDPSLARFVPNGAASFGFFSMQFGAAFDELLALAKAVQPVAANAINGQIDQFSSRAGIDVRADVIGGMAGRFVTFAMAGSPTQAGAMVELRQGATFARALGKLIEALPVKLQQGTTAGVPCWRVQRDEPGIAPAFAVVGNWLVVGSSDEALNAAARQVQSPRADPKVLAFLRSLPADSTGAMVAPVTAMTTAWFAPELPVPTADLGTRKLILRRSSDAFLAEERANAVDLMRSASATMTALMTPGNTPTTAPVATNHDDPKAAATLRDAEAEGSTRANVTAVAALLSHQDPAIVARACWLLGEWKAQDSILVLGDVAHEHADANVRLQATASLARIANTATAQALERATQDTDARVRLCAIQALGRLGAPIAASPVMALIDRLGSTRPDGSPQDLIAALVVVHDLGDPARLMPVASAIGFAHPQVGQALTFLFQGLSPRLAPEAEAKTLLAVLDHPEPMLRRYSIQRLGELRDPTTARALEGRLANEAADLQPLIRVSLTQVRGDVDRGDDDLVARAKSNVAAISQMVERRWNNLGSTGRIAASAAGCMLLLAALGLVVARRRSRRNRAVAEARSMVEPSVGYAASGREPHYEPEDEPVGAAHGDDRRY